MKKYKISFQKKDYNFDSVIVMANNKREAVKKFKPISTPSQRRILLANCQEIK